MERVRGVRARSRLRELDPSELPQHISIIMDGNRRFAWAHSMESGQGHSAGKERLKEVMKWVLDLDIPYLTVYALSSENLTNRTEEEIEILFDLYVQGLNEISVDPLIHENGVRVNAVGRLDMLPERVRSAISRAEEVTREYKNFTFTVCLAYGGREEIIDAVKSLAKDHADGDLEIDSIDANAISSRLYTSELPDPDLVIRTSGEERISNFLLWQIAYSELYFTDIHWPSFSRQDLYWAIEDYVSRGRRYGS
ncbi:MAG TPA: di-trans,poly-cis-decaprenylcistransferase [Candidatus Poseidoniales archaeon]|nr:MAG TPA: di-trans,poly-cis-decaprenylcistransferase [Candidatus Poseidoniales archaeon]